MESLSILPFHSCEHCKSGINPKTASPALKNHMEQVRTFNERVTDINQLRWSYQIRQWDLFQEGECLHPLLGVIEKIADFIQDLFHIQQEERDAQLDELNNIRPRLDQSIQALNHPSEKGAPVQQKVVQPTQEEKARIKTEENNQQVDPSKEKDEEVNQQTKSEEKGTQLQEINVDLEETESKEKVEDDFVTLNTSLTHPQHTTQEEEKVEPEQPTAVQTDVSAPKDDVRTLVPSDTFIEIPEENDSSAPVPFWDTITQYLPKKNGQYNPCFDSLKELLQSFEIWSGSAFIADPTLSGTSTEFQIKLPETIQTIRVPEEDISAFFDSPLKNVIKEIQIYFSPIETVKPKDKKAKRNSAVPKEDSQVPPEKILSFHVRPNGVVHFVNNQVTFAITLKNLGFAINGTYYLDQSGICLKEGTETVEAKEPGKKMVNPILTIDAENPPGWIKALKFIMPTLRFYKLSTLIMKSIERQKPKGDEIV